MTCDEAVLLIGFNRPDLLADVVDRVRAVQPARLYFAIDGPRANREAEAEQVQRCRDLATTVDWPCDVRTLFRDANLGCGRGVSGAISWFLEHEERGIIFEDDILADPTFFPFASELLDRYADDSRVFAITGTNFVPPQHISTHAQYRFSRVPVVWGWATWRGRWQQYRFDIAGWRARLPLRTAWPAMGGTVGSYAYWSGNFDMMARHAIDTWDLQLVFASMAAGALTATPNVNLVENVGFRPDATHTHRLPDYLRAVEPLLPGPPPPRVEVDERADRWTMAHVYEATALGLARQAGRYASRALNRGGNGA